jgi:hypothetical protein
MRFVGLHPLRMMGIGGAVGAAAVVGCGWNLAGDDALARPAKVPLVAAVVRGSAADAVKTASNAGDDGKAMVAERVAMMPKAVIRRDSSRHKMCAYTPEEGEEEIDRVLRAEKEIPEMARELFEVVLSLTGEGQVNASRHLVNLTTDEDYEELIAGLVVDAEMNPDVIEVLFSDLLNRGRELKMPTLLGILKAAGHPQGVAAKVALSHLAGKDFGRDERAWERWVMGEMRRMGR